MERFREFMSSGAGKAVAGGVIALALFALLLSIRSTFRQSRAAEESRERLFICSQTLKTFDFELNRGATIPAISPYTGQPTGYPAELCYWTRDGGSKSTPTPVCLNAYRGIREPTFCPDCGRLVIGHNPVPSAGAAPPPLQEEYAARPRHGRNHGDLQIRPD